MKDKFKNWFTGFAISVIGLVITFFVVFSIVTFVLMITSTGWASLFNFVSFIICLAASIKLPQSFIKEIEWWLSVRQSGNNDSTKE